MNRLVLAAIAAAITVPAVAQVAAPATRTGPMADGAMSLAEMQTRVATMFAKRDSNKDGALTADEMAGGKGMRRMGMAGADRKMATADPNAAFNRLDANKDGMISRDEFARGREMRMERRTAMGGERGAMRGKRTGGGMMGGHMLKMADTNKDGRVTLAEAQGTAGQHFAMADTNRDGRVTREEMRAMHQKMMPAAGGHAGHHG